MKILAALFFVIFHSENALSQSATTVESLIHSATQKSLSSTRAWKKLLHIEPNWIGIKGTQVTDPSFFLNPKKADARAELEATLRAFILPPDSFARTVLNNKKEKVIDHSTHAVCKYPARLKYLKENLSEHHDFWNSLPAVNCVFQKIFLEAVDAKSVSFVFSSYYSDSPGSAFGHTFFRINRKANVDRQELLDYGVGYAAQVSVDNPILYALMGIVGGFDGVWTNLPYYYKVREYNDYEARDLWSYDLNLTKDEVEMLSLHLWEIGSHTYTYYFFTQNCAFHMLTLLEAAAPRLSLIDHVPFWYVIPADSMKTLFEENALVNNVTFRPSLRRVFLKRYSELDTETQKVLKKFAANYELLDKQGELTDEQYARYLDTSLDLISLRHPDLNRDNNAKVYRVKEKLLEARAGINYVSSPVDIQVGENERPDKSHGSSRFLVGYHHYNKSVFFGYRFALHDLLDNTVGMPSNSQLEFFNFNFLANKNSVKLENFNLFKVLNLNPVNFFEKKLSWGLKVGSRRMDYWNSNVSSFYSSGIEAQFGYAYDLNLFNRPTVLYAMAKVDLGHASKTKNKQYGYVSAGYQLGFLKRFSDAHALHLTFEKMHANKLPAYENLELEFRSSLGRSLSIGVGADHKKFKSSLYYYF